MNDEIALVYDRVNKYGGAERVLQVLHDMYLQAPLYTAVYNPKTAPWADKWLIKPSFLNNLPFLRLNHQWLAPFMPYAFESFNFSPYKVVISVTSAEAKGILTLPSVKHLCYCLTPPRYLWHQTHLYAGGNGAKALRLPFLTAQRRWDLYASSRPDKLVAISKTVSLRIQKYYHRQPDAVIYPPVDTQKFTDHPVRCSTDKRGYYLVVSRLEAYKNIAPVIQAFHQLKDEALMIIGSGSLLSTYRHLAAGNNRIYFISSVSDNDLACFYAHARAVIFPQEEDFGLVAVEAQAAGVPVIALYRGGATETVVAHKTGLFFPSAAPAIIAQAIKDSQNIQFSPLEIKQHAQVYDKKVFMHEFSSLVEKLYG